jgi:hypothetical protein
MHWWHQNEAQSGKIRRAKEKTFSAFVSERLSSRHLPSSFDNSLTTLYEQPATRDRKGQQIRCRPKRFRQTHIMNCSVSVILVLIHPIFQLNGAMTRVVYTKAQLMAHRPEFDPRAESPLPLYAL